MFDELTPGDPVDPNEPCLEDLLSLPMSASLARYFECFSGLPVPPSPLEMVPAPMPDGVPRHVKDEARTLLRHLDDLARPLTLMEFTAVVKIALPGQVAERAPGDPVALTWARDAHETVAHIERQAFNSYVACGSDLPKGQLFPTAESIYAAVVPSAVMFRLTIATLRRIVEAPDIKSGEAS